MINALSVDYKWIRSSHGVKLVFVQKCETIRRLYFSFQYTFICIKVIVKIKWIILENISHKVLYILVQIKQ